MGLFDRFRDPEVVREREQEKARAAAEREELRRQALEAERAREEQVRANSEWTYREERDEMRGITKSFAQLISENAVHLAFPYNGGSQLLVTIRKTGPQHEVLLIVTNGQFDGNSFDGFSFSAKFGDGSIENWTASAADDGSSNVMFVTNPARFVKQLSRVARATIELPFYSNGRQQFLLNPLGLDKRFLG